MTSRSLTLLGIGLLPVILLGQASKQDLKADEASIRASIAANNLDYTDDAVAWNGAFKRPTEGSEPKEAFLAANMGKRKNQKTSVTVMRLELASSGDMAWEFSRGKLEYDVDDSDARHFKIEQGILRVWVKSDGHWKVVAFFIRPMDLPFVYP